MRPPPPAPTSALGRQSAAEEDTQHRLTEELPLGWKQRLALGCAMVHEPEILFLDEPTSGVDPVARRRVWDLIDGMSNTGTTVFVSTHYMEEAEYCHRLALLNRGRLIALDLRVEDGLPRVNADKDRITQVMWNLLGNAMKFTNDGGSVLVAAASDEATVRLSVIDDGPGISRDAQKSLFDRFSRAKRNQGVGLGLAISKRIVEAHGGRIWVESEFGKGSVFILRSRSRSR